MRRQSRYFVLMISMCNYAVHVASESAVSPVCPASPINTPPTPTLHMCHWCPLCHPCLSAPFWRSCPPPPGFPAPPSRPLPDVPSGLPDLQILTASPVSPFEQSKNDRASSVQALYHWVRENLVETIAVASVVTFFIVLALKLDSLISPSLTQSDLPSDPSQYKAYICFAFSIQTAEVIDLTGHIDRRRFIAAGGSGEVYEASWTNLNKNSLISTPEALPRAVVKLIKMPPLRDEVTKNKRYKRMKRELVLWSKLNHPHILPLIGIARIEGDANLPAFISPWMENGNVMEFLKQNPSFPSCRFLKDIIKGLHYLHTFKPVVVHGDIKGANVLVNHRKEAYLSDFGLSYFVQDNTLWRTTAARAIGTLRWMAPELIGGAMVTPTIPSDIYAYAMTCYEILSRETPFAVANDPVVMFQVLDGQRPERIESCHNDTIWSIITRCWAHEPEDRPPTEETLDLILQLDEVSIKNEDKSSE